MGDTKLKYYKIECIEVQFCEPIVEALRTLAQGPHIVSSQKEAVAQQAIIFVSDLLALNLMGTLENEPSTHEYMKHKFSCVKTRGTIHLKHALRSPRASQKHGVQSRVLVRGGTRGSSGWLIATLHRRLRTWNHDPKHGGPEKQALLGSCFSSRIKRSLAVAEKMILWKIRRAAKAPPTPPLRCTHPREASSGCTKHLGRGSAPQSSSSGHSAPLGRT